MKKDIQQDLTSGQAAKYCGVSVRTLLNWINKGFIEAYKLPGERGDHRIQPDALVSFMERSEIPIPQELEEQKPVILIVDDELNLCRAIQRALHPLDAYTFFAHSAFEAGRKYNEHKPKLMTVDIHMPNMNGINLVKQLKEERGNCCKIIVITGADESWQNRAIFAGADAVFPKPFDNSNLLEKAKQFLAP